MRPKADVPWNPPPQDSFDFVSPVLAHLAPLPVLKTLNDRTMSTVRRVSLMFTNSPKPRADRARAKKWVLAAISSLTATRLAEYFDVDQHTLTTSITLTLLFRSLGAAIFGLLGDRYGRKWPLIWDLLICMALVRVCTHASFFSS